MVCRPAAWISAFILAVLARPALATDLDAEVGAAVARRVSEDGLIKIEKFEVNSRAGVVGLGGVAADLRSRDRAVAIAALTRGVRAVESRLTLAPSWATDADVALMVEGRLRATPGLRSSALQAVAARGVVTLNGVAPRWADRRLAEAIARSVRGVREVRDNLRLHSGGRPDPAPGVQSADPAGIAVRPGAGLALQAPPPGDEQIVAAVRRELTLDPRLEGSTLHVSVRRGLLLLTGTTPSIGVAAAAEQTATMVEGVRDVKTGITVVAPGRPTAASMAGEVGLALEADPVLSRRGLHFSVADRLVRLEGRVANPAEDRLAVELAAGVNGVEGVEDHLEVERDPGRIYTDQELYHEVRYALRWDVLVDPSAVTVEVRDGVAVVRSRSGLAEAALAGRSALRAGLDGAELRGSAGTTSLPLGTPPLLSQY